jgi:hypothetical protein
MAKQVAETQKSEVAEVPQVTFQPYSPLNMQTWDEANESAIEFPGYDLLTDERADKLQDVPFLIVGATFRPGITSTEGRSMAYVSVECMVAPAPLITRRGIDPNTLPFGPESHVVFNDGSTGVYRQIVAALEGIGYIKLGDNGSRENAPKGESIFDQPPGEWADVRFGDLRFDEEGRGVYYAPIRLRAPRGLRLSTYENEFTTGQATTRYIA